MRNFLGAYSLTNSAIQTKDSMPSKPKISYSIMQTPHKHNLY